MIFVRFCGGLGNQLFQYATGLSLAAKHNVDLVMDLDWYSNIPATDTPRKFELDGFNISARRMTRHEERLAWLHRGRLARRLTWIPRAWQHVREHGGDFDPGVLNAENDAYLDGYWQSPGYFRSIEPLLRTELTVKRSPGSEDMQILGAMPKGRSVAVHVRRGDYVTLAAAAQMHGVSLADYYVNAMGAVLSKIANPHFFVFSDDIPWVRDNLTFPGEVCFVDHNGPDAAVADLHLMASCAHQVIANSSFSWWAAWLNPNPEKTVIAPANWYADGRPTPTLLPDSWIRL